MDDTRAPADWWGAFMLAEGQAGRWRLGPSTVWICRARHEWRLFYEDAGDGLKDVAEVAVPLPPEEPVPALDDEDTTVTVTRFSMQQTGERLALWPSLADRAVVVRPEKALYVPEGEAVTLYVSTPLWLRVEEAEAGRLLHEVPLHRPSDTWFGPSTMEGELCYALRTAGRLELGALPFRRHRAITPVRIRNRAKEALLLERARLPVEYLALYHGPDGFLWTPGVVLERDRDEELATLRLEDGPPAEVPEARLLREPRQSVKTSLIVRPFSMLFHKIKEA